MSTTEAFGNLALAGNGEPALQVNITNSATQGTVGIVTVDQVQQPTGDHSLLPQDINITDSLDWSDDDDTDITDDENSEVEDREYDVRTHSGRNPTQPVIAPTHNQPKKKMDSVTRKHMKAARREADEKYEGAIQEVLDEQIQKIKDIAKTYNKKESQVHSRITGEQAFKKERSISLHNTKIHWMAKKLNEDRGVGERAGADEIFKAIAADPKVNNPGKKMKKKMLRSLKKHRNMKQTGMCVNNRAANMDIQCTMERVNTEVERLHQRTGALAFTIATRGHVNDMAPPCVGAFGGIEEFCMDTFERTPLEMGRQLDAYAVAKVHEEKFPNTLSKLQAECARMIWEGLKDKLNRGDVKMLYTQYDWEIRLQHHVKLIGWPGCVEFRPPSRITARSKLVMLHDALRDGECHWHSMTTAQVNELNAKLKTLPPKERAQRKDKGGKHQKRKCTDENEVPAAEGQHRLTKKLKGKAASLKSQLPPFHVSNSTA